MEEKLKKITEYVNKKLSIEKENKAYAILQKILLGDFSSVVNCTDISGDMFTTIIAELTASGMENYLKCFIQVMTRVRMCDDTATQSLVEFCHLFALADEISKDTLGIFRANAKHMENEISNEHFGVRFVAMHWRQSAFQNGEWPKVVFALSQLNFVKATSLRNDEEVRCAMIQYIRQVKPHGVSSSNVISSMYVDSSEYKWKMLWSSVVFDLAFCIIMKDDPFLLENIRNLHLCISPEAFFPVYDWIRRTFLVNMTITEYHCYDEQLLVLLLLSAFGHSAAYFDGITRPLLVYEVSLAFIKVGHAPAYFSPHTRYLILSAIINLGFSRVCYTGLMAFTRNYTKYWIHDKSIFDVNFVAGLKNVHSATYLKDDEYNNDTLQNAYKAMVSGASTIYDITLISINNPSDPRYARTSSELRRAVLFSPPAAPVEPEVKLVRKAKKRKTTRDRIPIEDTMIDVLLDKKELTGENIEMLRLTCQFHDNADYQIAAFRTLEALKDPDVALFCRRMMNDVSFFPKIMGTKISKK